MLWKPSNDQHSKLILSFVTWSRMLLVYIMHNIIPLSCIRDINQLMNVQFCSPSSSHLRDHLLLKSGIILCSLPQTGITQMGHWLCYQACGPGIFTLTSWGHQLWKDWTIIKCRNWFRKPDCRQSSCLQVFQKYNHVYKFIKSL